MIRVNFFSHKVILRDTFKVSRESYKVLPCLYVIVASNGMHGIGEATEFMPNAYNSNLKDMLSKISIVKNILGCSTTLNPEELWGTLEEKLRSYPFLLSAIDVALWDLYAKSNGIPLYRQLGLDSSQAKRSIYSIGLCDLEELPERIKIGDNWEAIKLKLGDKLDIERVALAKTLTNKSILVDANCGWSFEEAKRKSYILEDLGVKAIEQPLPVDKKEEMIKLKRISPIEFIADESCTSTKSLDACIECFDVINIKSMKAGGITPALAMITTARNRGAKVMMGCMPESYVGISATAQLSPLLDIIELDSIVHIDSHSAAGIEINDGKIVLNLRPGTSAKIIDKKLKVRIDTWLKENYGS